MKENALLSVFLCFVLTPYLWLTAQDQPTETAATGTAQADPVREPGAVAAIELAVAAMGGRTAIGQIRDCVAQGTVQAAEGSSLTSGGFVWKNAGAEFRYENPGSAGAQVTVSGHGRPASVENGELQRLSGNATAAHIPSHLIAAVLFKELANPTYLITVDGLGTVGERQVIRVRTVWELNDATASVSPQVWFLDVSTGLPLRVEYRIPEISDALNYLTGAIEFSDFRNVSGVVVPFRITTYTEGDWESTITINSIALNTGISPLEFDAPAGGGQ